MVVARASGTDLASSLKQTTFLTLGVHPVAGSARDGGTRGSPGRGPRGGPGTGGHAGAPGRGGTQGPDTVLAQPSRRNKNCGTIFGFAGMTEKNHGPQTKLWIRCSGLLGADGRSGTQGARW